MTEDTIVIILKDRDPLVVTKQSLVENSSVFSKIFLECGHKEHHIPDFTPEIVEMFFTLLDDKKVERIEESDFRELHKISVVFNVQWLIESCRDWLDEKIRNIEEIIDYDSMFFLFEECFYIHSKWNMTRFMETLILKMRFRDNSLFLSRYIRNNYDLLKNDQSKFLLHLSASNSKVILELIIERIADQEHLDDPTRYFLQNMKFSFCLQQNEQLYYEMMEKLSGMSDMSNSDLRMVLKLTTAATKAQTCDCKNQTVNNTSLKTISDFVLEEWLSMYGDCECLADIKRLIAECRISNMHSVIEILAKVTYTTSHTTEELEGFVESIERLHPQKVSTSYIDLLISALDFSKNDRKAQFMKLLTMIRNSEHLSSNYHTIQLVGENTAQSQGTSVVKSVKNVLGLRKPHKYVFRIKHPGNPLTNDCTRKVDCGFILTEGLVVGGHILSEEAKDYTKNQVHLHDLISSENMNWYRIMTGTTGAGEKVRVPVRWKQWWSDWLCECFSANWEKEEQCVDYVISDLLVAK